MIDVGKGNECVRFFVSCGEYTVILIEVVRERGRGEYVFIPLRFFFAS